MRVFDFLYQQAQQFPRPDALAYKYGADWTSFSTAQVLDLVNQLGAGLLRAGVQKGDKIAIVSANRPEWVIADYALQQIGVVVVPVYPTITADDMGYIFEHAEVSLIFASSEELHDRVKETEKGGQVPVYTFDELSAEKAPHWKKLLCQDAEWLKAVGELRDQVLPEDLMTIIYTSGTTGRPKGVMLSHRNVSSNVKGIQDFLVIEKGKSRVISFLPLSHIYERVAIALYLSWGASIYFAKTMESIAEDIREVKPHMFTTVPRLMEKIFDKIVTKGLEMGGVKKQLLFWAINLGLQYNPLAKKGWLYDVQLKLARKLIFSKWQEALGGNIQMITCGSAALQPRLAHVFWAADIKVLEGYGMTEASPVISANYADADRMRIGTVGLLLDQVEVKIAEDGEILCKGPNVMMGYYKQPEATAETLKDGWLHTGDIGEWVEGRFLKITDRKKEMFKTSGGKYVAPQIIEGKLQEALVIEQAVVFGNDRKFPSALIAPNFIALADWCKHVHIPYTTDAEMIKDPRVIEKFQREVDKCNESLAQWEKIKRFTLMPCVWTIDNGELTPTMKVKRKVVYEKSLALIEKMYDGNTIV